MTGALLFALALAQAAPGPCDTAEGRALDFWVGDWTVLDAATGKPVGRSLVTREWGGCALREQFTGDDGFTGGSLNAWDRELGRWRQFGAGSTGAARLFEGGVADGGLDLKSETKTRAGAPAVLRMTLRPAPEGRVRQTSTISTDGGATWRPRYDFLYVPG